MKVLSLFDGISCARVALERAGISVESYYASEIDKYAMQISVKNYPDIVHMGSITGVNFMSQFLNRDPFDKGVDLIIGGSPCQDLSIAKKNRKGLDGERSGLFWEYVRILKEVKPKYFILENVNSMPKEAKQLITETLGVEPIMINASLVSAQNRKRLFWTNIPGVTLPKDRCVLLKDILEDNVDEKYNVNISEKSGLKGLCEEKAKSLTASSYKGYGNDGVSIVRVGQIGKGGQGDRIYSPEGKSVGLSALGGGRGAKTGLYIASGDVRKLTPIECERLQGLPDNYTAYGNVLQEVNLFSNIEIWKNVLLKAVKEKRKQILVRVSCTTNDIKDTEVLNCLLENLRDVYCVIANLSQKGGAETITTIGIGTMTQNIQIRLENETGQPLEVNTDIYETLMENGDIEMLLKSISAEPSHEMKSYIISTLTNLIIGLRTSISVQEENTCLFIINLKNLLLNSSKTEQLVLKMEHTTSISSMQRYKTLGNAFNVDVVTHILSFIK